MSDILQEKYILNSIIPASNTKAVMADKNGEKYIAPVVCWGKYDTFISGELVYSTVKGLILGPRETLVELQNNEAFKGYLYGDEDSSSLPDNRS